MYKKDFFLIFFFLFFSSIVYGEDYGFSMDEFETIETKPYEFGGYLKADYKYQSLNKDSKLYKKAYQKIYSSELFLNYSYFKENFSFELEENLDYENIDSKEDYKSTLNQVFTNYKFNQNHQINIGKISPKWGKGYYFNPVAFVDRKKDPNDPEASREGFVQVNHKYNKVYNGDIQNLSFDTLVLKTTKDINEDLYKGDSNIAAFKLYMLYRDIDIDFIYSYSNKDTNKAGVDFSTNLDTNFEIHGEYARYDNGYFSYLFGLKYLTQNDLTIISEYFYQNSLQNKTTSFWDKQYFINSFTQKEPFDILYFNIYFKNMLNLEDNSFQNKGGLVYNKIKNLELEFSLAKNYGDKTSEFGSKFVERTAWIELKYSF